LAQKCTPYDSSDWAYELGAAGQEVGTSASSPDTVGLLALASEIAHSPLGDVHALLYKKAKVAGLFHRGIPGNNGGYPTTTGLWDPVLGLGTPDAAYKLVGAKSAAGVPGSSSNP
jgi:subtilase family serine protease